MNLTVTGRHFDVTQSLKEYSVKKLAKIDKLLPGITDARIVLSVEKHRHNAEVNINHKGTIVHTKEISDDMYSSIDKVIVKLESLVKKHREKLKNKNNSEILDARYETKASDDEDLTDDDNF